MSASTGLNLSGAGQPLPTLGVPGSDVEKREPQQPSPADQPTSPAPFVAPVQVCPNPKCGREIDTLKVWIRADDYFDYYLGKTGTPTWDQGDSYPIESEYSCPECDFLLTRSESEAEAFLTNGTVPEGAKERADSIGKDPA